VSSHPNQGRIHGIRSAGCRRPPPLTGHVAGLPPRSTPRNKGEQYPADPPTVEEIIEVMRVAGERADGHRLRALIVLLWRAGLRISEALALQESDLNSSRGAILVRRGKGGKRREVGMDRWAWSQLEPWLQTRRQLPIGALLCVIHGPTAGRRWEASAWSYSDSSGTPTSESRASTYRALTAPRSSTPSTDGHRIGSAGVRRPTRHTIGWRRGGAYAVNWVRILLSSCRRHSRRRPRRLLDLTGAAVTARVPPWRRRSSLVCVLWRGDAARCGCVGKRARLTEAVPTATTNPRVWLTLRRALAGCPRRWSTQTIERIARPPPVSCSLSRCSRSDLRPRPAGAAASTLAARAARLLY